MKIREQRKKNFLVLLLILLCSIGLGYALLQTNLTINGTSKIKGNTWDIHFANLNVTEGSVSIGTGDSAAAIQSSTTDITYTVTLNQPGDFYEFTVDVVNGGSINAMLDSIAATITVGNGNPISIDDSNFPSYLAYTVTYSDGIEIKRGDALAANRSEKILVRVEFLRDIDSEDLSEASGQKIECTLSETYVQADGTEHKVRNGSRIVYAIDTTFTNELGENVGTTIGYLFPEEFMVSEETARAKRIYLKAKLDEDGIVEESYVVFIITPEMVANDPGLVEGTYELKIVREEETSGEEALDNYYNNEQIVSNASGTGDISAFYNIYLSEHGIVSVIDAISFYRCNTAEYSSDVSCSD